MAENETLDLWDRHSGRWRRLLKKIESSAAGLSFSPRSVGPSLALSVLRVSKYTRAEWGPLTSRSCTAWPRAHAPRSRRILVF